VDCHPISITWNGQTKSGTGSHLVVTFQTHKGDAHRKALKSDVASCTYTDPGGTQHTVSSNGRVIIDECKKGNGDDDDDDDSDGDDDDDHGSLPNTGGERLMWLILGALLLVGGGATVASSRSDGRDART
jgi:LPXTG-motif cell wall-anchored protein